LSALIETASGKLLSFRPRQVTHQPAPPGGRSSTIVQYGAQVLRWAGGQVASETLVMATGGRIRQRAAVVDGDGVRVGIWRWPFDPDLPGLASAVDADTVSALLADLGMGGGKVRLTVRAYRPGRRAVIEASGSQGRVFLKVVRPHRVEALHAPHRLLARHLPVPHSYGYSTDGILVRQGLYGGSLRGALTGSAVPLPDAGALQGLLDQLPADLAETQIRGDHLGRAAHYTDVVASCLPDERTRLDELLGHLAGVDPGDHPTVAVHGDFYEGQILVNRERVSVCSIPTRRAPVTGSTSGQPCWPISPFSACCTLRRGGSSGMARSCSPAPNKLFRRRIAPPDQRPCRAVAWQCPRKLERHSGFEVPWR